MNSIALNIFRSRRGKSFRKTLGVYDYKIGHNRLHKKPGLMDLELKQRLIKEGSHVGKNRIAEYERNSPRMYGSVGKKGHFVMDKSKLPFFNIPDLTGFELKPYVSYHTPKLGEEVKSRMKELNDFKDEKNFGRYVNKMESIKGEKSENE